MSDVTQILSAIEQGNPKAAEQLLPLIYDELRKLAAQKMVKEKPGQTLSATALVHEAYMRLVDSEKAQQWDSRGHFFAAAAEAMRRILVDQSRRKRSLRRGGGLQRYALEHVEITMSEPSIDVTAVDEALTRFEQLDKLKADLVKLRYFAGLTTLRRSCCSARSSHESTPNTEAHLWNHEKTRCASPERSMPDGFLNYW